VVILDLMEVLEQMELAQVQVMQVPMEI